MILLLEYGLLLLLWVYLAMVCIGVDSEVVGGVDREVVVVSVRVGVVNVKVDVDIVVVGVCGFAAAEVVGEGVGGIAAAAHFVVVVGVSEVRAIVAEDVGEGDGGMAVAAHFVVVTGVVGVESMCDNVFLIFISWVIGSPSTHYPRVGSCNNFLNP